MFELHSRARYDRGPKSDPPPTLDASGSASTTLPADNPSHDSSALASSERPPDRGDDPDARCQAAVAAFEKSGGVGLTTTEALDQQCQWRIEDANHDSFAGSIAQARGLPPQPGPQGESVPIHPGLHAINGRSPPATVSAAFKARAVAVRACAREVQDAPAVLRVRVVIESDGAVSWAGTDYRHLIAPKASACVEEVLRSSPFPRPEASRVIAVYAFAFGGK